MLMERLLKVGKREMGTDASAKSSILTEPFEKGGVWLSEGKNWGGIDV
jgi:hypothetical protein